MARKIEFKCQDCGTLVEIEATMIDPDWPEWYCNGCEDFIEVPVALINSAFDPDGVYNAHGECIGTTRPRCEDAPCCGCCN